MRNARTKNKCAWPNKHKHESGYPPDARKDILVIKPVVRGPTRGGAIVLGRNLTGTTNRTIETNWKRKRHARPTHKCERMNKHMHESSFPHDARKDGRVIKR